MKFDFIKQEIKDQYLIDNRPWIIGYSGGKDSTSLLQMVWYALREIEVEKRTKEIHVVSNDTLVENPKISKWISDNVKLIEEQAKREGFPITVAMTYPAITDTFWVNLIGKGYPAPNSSFRWCTDRLKIKPTSAYIKQQVAEKGEVVILLGTRRAESANRSKTIKKYSMSGLRLRRHTDLQHAYVYSPLEYLTTDDIWQYLLQVPSPWAGSNRPLITLYKNASGGDCPLVIDESTPSCGQSRFGCWVCTVVNKDKSMESLIENGEEYLEPLLEIRDWLVENRSNDDHRMMKLRNGAQGKGPYKLSIRALILEKVLEAQKTTGEKLITPQELRAIQRIWSKEDSELSVSRIYNKFFDEKIDFGVNEIHTVEQEQQDLLKQICEREGADYGTIQKILNLKKQRTNNLQKTRVVNEIIKMI